MATSATKPEIIGLIIPTRWEAQPIIRALGFRRMGCRRYQAEQNGRRFLIQVCGIGREAAWHATQELCDAGATMLVSVGFCGALVEGLPVGAIVRDRVATSPTMLWTREDRLELAAKANAQAVDMETQAIIEAGTRRGVPIRVLRAVSDQLNHDFSPLFPPGPAFSRVRLLLRLWRPSNWVLLIQMWRQARVASAALVDSMRRWMAGELPAG